MTPIQSTLVKIALDVNAGATLKDSSDLDRKFSEVGIDSLETMSVMLGAMEHFKISIPDEQVEKLATINELADYVERQLAKSPREP